MVSRYDTTELKFSPPFRPGSWAYVELNGRYRQVHVEEVFPHYAIVTARVLDSPSGRLLRRPVRWGDLDAEPRGEFVSYSQ